MPSLGFGAAGYPIKQQKCATSTGTLAPVNLDQRPPALPHVKSGKLMGIGTTADKELGMYANAMTFKQVDSRMPRLEAARVVLIGAHAVYRLESSHDRVNSWTIAK